MIALEKIGFSYPGPNDSAGKRRPVLQGINLEIRPAEFTGILGPNGSGKTTLLKNINLFLKPDRGTIYYFAKPHQQMTSREMARRLSLVPQKAGGGLSLQVREMVLLGRIPHIKNRWEGYTPEDYREVDRVLESLGLTPFTDRYCYSLSGGEFQKVLLARALAQQSDILLLDEATANLDIQHCIDIMELVRQKTKDGAAVLAVMHDLNLAAGFCDRVVFMQQGHIVCRGKPSEVYSRQLIRQVYGIDAHIGRDKNGIPFVLPRRAEPGADFPEQHLQAENEKRGHRVLCS